MIKIAYGTAANINILTGNAFSSTDVAAAIVVADNEIDTYCGTTFTSPPTAVTTVADRVAARILQQGLRMHKVAKGESDNYNIVTLTKDEKKMLDSILDTDLDKISSQAFE